MASAKSNAAAASGSLSLGLQKRLLEVAVVVGFDEETGLNQRHLVSY